jgi:restriction system protein
MAVAGMPPYHELLWPTLQAVQELGGSASIDEIVETVIKNDGLSDEQQEVLHHDGPGPSLDIVLPGRGLISREWTC